LGDATIAQRESAEKSKLVERKLPPDAARRDEGEPQRRIGGDASHGLLDDARAQGTAERKGTRDRFTRKGPGGDDEEVVRHRGAVTRSDPTRLRLHGLERVTMQPDADLVGEVTQLQSRRG